MRESYEECVECERQRHGGLSPIYIYIYNKRSVTILSVLAVHRPFYISIYIYIYIFISPYSFLCIYTFLLTPFYVGLVIVHAWYGNFVSFNEKYVVIFCSIGF